MITQAEVKKLFIYKNGYLYWRNTGTGRRLNLNEPAGTIHPSGYVIIWVNDHQYKAHQLIFIMHYGYLPKEIDHIDENKPNNRIENLRACTHAQNQQNSKKPRHNTSGVKGVYWDRQHKFWTAYLSIDGKMKVLGCFWDIYTAELTVRRERIKLHGEFANHG